ncbi:MAG: glycosyltransferase [Phycisphaeraceae bacterium]|nr:glycosyltransferase [Phycisphaerales bacterium]MCB9860988.1 glycosyltransferase [Phycisphaeraceae bacterium]
MSRTTTPALLTVVSVIRADPLATDQHFASIERERAHASETGCQTDHVIVRCMKETSVPHAVNDVLRQACGVYVCVLFDSDCFEQGALRWACETLQHESDAGAIIGDCRLSNEQGMTTWRPAPISEVSAELIAKPLTHWFAGRCLVGPEVVFRRETALALGGFDEQRMIAFDYSLWLCMLLEGHRLQKHARAFVCRMESDKQPGPEVGDALRDVARAGLGLLSDKPQNWRADAVREHTAISIRSQALDIVEARMRLIESNSNMECGSVSCAHVGVDALLEGRQKLLKPHMVDTGRHVRSALGSAGIRGPRVAIVGCDAVTSRDPVEDWFDRGASVECVEVLDGSSAFDCVVLDGALCLQQNPEIFLDRAWRSVASNGCLVALGELGPWNDLDLYMHRLRGRMRERLLWTTDVFLDVDADEQLAHIFGAPAPVSFDTDKDATAWLRLFPGWRGCDVFRLMQEIAPASALRLARRYGSIWFHPVLPLPWIAALHVPQQDLWQVGVWQHVG